MKIIGSGFGRTGTLSMKQALEELGFGPCYHMEEVIKHPRHIKYWDDVSNGKSKDWDKIFEGYQATVDFPASIFYKDLMEHYPDAKIIHTIRDPERWYKSTYETIYQMNYAFPRWVTIIVRPLGQFLDMTQVIWSTLFEDRFGDRDYAIRIFQEFTKEVEQTVPSERLLIFEVKQGWQPLCDFLGVPVPDTPFPHVNDRDSMLRRIKTARLVTQLAPVAIIGLMLMGILLLSTIF